MTDEEADKLAEEWRNSLNYEIDNDTFNNIVIPCIKFGYEQGIGRLRYCCTCKKWIECKVESMYGICADWEIKGE